MKLGDAISRTVERFGRVPGRAARLRIGERGHQVLLAIALYVDRDGYAKPPHAPSLTRISLLTGIDRRDIPRIEHSLEEAGLLMVQRPGRGRRNIYQIIYAGAHPDEAEPGVGSQTDTKCRFPDRHQVSAPRPTECRLSNRHGVGSQTDMVSPSRPTPSVGSQTDTIQIEGSNGGQIGERYISLEDDDLEIARRRGYELSWIADQTDRFRDHCLANGKNYSDVRAGWRNWIRVAMERDEYPPEPPSPACDTATATTIKDVVREHLGEPGLRLLSRIGEATWRHWFREIRWGGVRDDTLCLTAPNKFIRDKLRQDFEPYLRASWGVTHVEIIEADNHRPENLA